MGRIATLAACFALFTNLLLISCSSVGDTASRRKPPTSPESIQIRVAEKGLEVHWKEVPGATYYTIFWGTETGQYKSMANADSTSALITDVKEGDLYYIAMTSWNARGESNFSAEQTIVYDTNPERAVVYLAKGNEAMKQGLTNQAHAYFCATIRLDPENADAYRSRAVLYEAINWNDLARKDYATAQKLQKNRPISTRVSSK
jgi:tetratricopeptide (TPR) repeat protein